MRKNGLRAIGLSFLAVLGLMAFMGASAQATWLENLAEITANKEVLIAAHTAGVLDIPADELEIECKKVAGDDLLILALSAGPPELKAIETSGTLLFTECETFQLKGTPKVKTLQGLCKPVEPIKASGKGKLVLTDAGKNEVLFEPNLDKEGKPEPFGLIKFAETCSLPLSNKVNGTLLVECLNTSLAKVDCNEDAKVHLLQQDTTSKVGGVLDALKYGSGEKAANILGVAKVELASGNFWAGHV